MKTTIKIILIITGLLSLTNLILGLSFKNELLDKVIIGLFALSLTFLISLELPKIWMKLASILVISVLSYSVYFIWQIFGYESRIDYVWTGDNYEIELEHRLEIAGPGCYWFLVNKNILWGTMEKRIETRQYQAGLPNPPEIFEFNTDTKKILVQCCDLATLQGARFE